MTDTANREQDVSAVLLELAGWRPSADDATDYLDTLLQRSCAAVGAGGGAVLVDRAQGDLEPLVASEEGVRRLERAEAERQQGPGVDAYHSGRRAVCQSVTEAASWPWFARGVRELGFSAVFAFPLQWQERKIGSVTVLRQPSGPVATERLRCVQALAQMATIRLLQQRAVHDTRREAEQLHTALHSRVIIEQAKGILAAHGDLSMDESFAALRAYSRDSNRKLHDVAQAVANGELSCPDLLAPERHQPAEGPADGTDHAPSASHDAGLMALVARSRTVREAAGGAQRDAARLRRQALQFQQRG